MRRIPQIIFAVSLVLLCWLGMMAVHELGHVVGAILTGGSVTQVVLNPVTISRTDVSPSPMPGIVVWAGPLTGSILPLAFLMACRGRGLRRSAFQFFSGFCLIANGAYISAGSFEGIGDAGEMLRTGTPVWLMLIFGVVTVPGGFLLWHRTGSLRVFFNNPDSVTDRQACITAALLGILLLAEFLLSPISFQSFTD